MCKGLVFVIWMWVSGMGGWWRRTRRCHSSLAHRTPSRMGGNGGTLTRVAHAAPRECSEAYEQTTI